MLTAGAEAIDFYGVAGKGKARSGSGIKYGLVNLGVIQLHRHAAALANQKVALVFLRRRWTTDVSIKAVNAVD